MPRPMLAGYRVRCCTDCRVSPLGHVTPSCRACRESSMSSRRDMIAERRIETPRIATCVSASVRSRSRPGARSRVLVSWLCEFDLAAPHPTCRRVTPVTRCAGIDPRRTPGGGAGTSIARSGPSARDERQSPPRAGGCSLSAVETNERAIRAGAGDLALRRLHLCPARASRPRTHALNRMALRIRPIAPHPPTISGRPGPMTLSSSDPPWLSPWSARWPRASSRSPSPVECTAVDGCSYESPCDGVSHHRRFGRRSRPANASSGHRRTDESSDTAARPAADSAETVSPPAQRPL